jgi:hypothetical protein
MRTRRAFSALRGIVASLPTLSAQRARRSQSANAEFIGQRRNHWPTSKSLANVEIIGQRRNHWPTSKSLANVEFIGQRRNHWPTSKSSANVEIIGQCRGTN